MGSERGQGTVEYVGAVLLLALALAGTVTAVAAWTPGTALARTVVAKLLCAVRLDGDCGEEASGSHLALAYGHELAAEVAGHVPVIGFEDGEFASLPVDFRRCRHRGCADTSEPGAVERSFAGERPTAFVRVIDCRDPGEDAGADCGGSAGGRLYLQYWLYFPDSATRPFGERGYHADDWESYQVRVGSDGAVHARASSHRGYNGGGTGPQNALSDLGLAGTRWGEATGYLRIARGSHAGSLRPDIDDPWRVEPASLRLVPLEPAIDDLDSHQFAVTPPWRKAVWRNPESPDT